jgi:hypothetical protein
LQRVEWGALARHYRVCNRIDMMARRVAYRRHIVGVGRRPFKCQQGRSRCIFPTNHRRRIVPLPLRSTTGADTVRLLAL